MTDSTPISKLAAILAADVVGFSLKMGENEYLTLKNLKACRAIVDSAIKNNQGRIFTTAGETLGKSMSARHRLSAASKSPMVSTMVPSRSIMTACMLVFIMSKLCAISYAPI